MSNPSSNISVRTIVLFVVLVSVIGYLFYFAGKKSSESAARAGQCQDQCAKDGYTGSSFKWTVLSGPQCECLGEVFANRILAQ